jgi:hypothetical protein
MAEKTAAELLYAQFDHDVATAKERLVGHYGGGVQALAWVELMESMMESVIKRWWLKRMTSRHDLPVDVTELNDRMNHRTNAIVQMTQGIIEKSGPIEPTALQMQVLGMSAEVNALWGCLIEAGLMTPANRQDYMDAAIAMLYKRMQENPKIVMPEMSKRAS